MKKQRIENIELYIQEHKNVSLDELCRVFSISKNTVRRDVAELVQKGSVKKIYGGVSVTDTPTLRAPLLSYGERSEKNMEGKSRICRLASELIEEGDTIFIDSGTTCIHLLDYLGDKECTVLTHSLLLQNEAARNPNITVVSVPGKLNRKTFSFAGADLQPYLEMYNINKAFMACTGVSIRNGLTNATMEEYITKRAVYANSNVHILLADSTKFDKISLMTYAPMETLDYIVTDEKLNSDYVDFCRKNQIELLVSEDQKEYSKKECTA